VVRRNTPATAKDLETTFSGVLISARVGGAGRAAKKILREAWAIDKGSVGEGNPRLRQPDLNNPGVAASCLVFVRGTF